MAGNRVFQNCFISENADNTVVDLDPVDNGLDYCLAKWDYARRNSLTHCSAKFLQRFLGEFRLRRVDYQDPVQRYFCAFTLKLENGYTILQNIVEIRHSGLDHFV